MLAGSAETRMPTSTAIKEHAMNKNTQPSTAAARRRLLLGACALACLAATSQASAGEWSAYAANPVQGSGNIKRQVRDVGQFSGVAMSLAGKVDVRRGDREGVTVEADDNLLPLIETVVEDGTLHIRNKRGSNINTRNLKVTVQARELDRLALGGMGSIDADRVNGARVQFDIGGSGSISVGKIEGERIVANIGGRGDLKANEGATRTVSISIGGMGTVDLGRVQTNSANVTVAGSGNATLWVRDSLSLTIAGSGDINYYGDPKVSKSVLGSGNVRRLGPSPR
jgi:hypothetical protein